MLFKNRRLLLAICGSIPLAVTSFPLHASEFLNLTIIHTNDVHSHVDQFNEAYTNCTPEQYAQKRCHGGTARHKTIIDRLRAENRFSLLLDGGDEFQGTMFYTYYKGNVTSQVMNLLGYNLTTIGNHEFDSGPDVLAAHYKRLKMPVVCANIDTTRNPNLGQYIRPYHIFPEYKLAVIGYITETAGGISNAGPTLSFSDPIPSVQKYVYELHAKGIKRILTLSHNGYDQDKILAANTHGVAVHVGGHSHTLLSNMKADEALAKGPYPTVVKNLLGDDTLIVQAYWAGKYIGHLDVVLDADGRVVEYSGEPILADQSIPQSPVVQSIVTDWREQFDRFAATVIGQARHDFYHTTCQGAECSIGNLVSDAMLWSRASNPNVVAAVINAGSIRTGLSQGNITRGGVLTMIPFGNSLVEVVLTGKNITDMLESVVGGTVNIISGKLVTSFLQVSGIRFTYDSSKKVFERLAEVKIWDPLVKDYVLLDSRKLYTIVTLDFVARTGDGILPYPIKDTVPLEEDEYVVEKYIEAKKVVEPYFDGRIKDLASEHKLANPSANEPLHYGYVGSGGVIGQSVHRSHYLAPVIHHQHRITFTLPEYRGVDSL